MDLLQEVWDASVTRYHSKGMHSRIGCNNRHAIPGHDSYMYEAVGKILYTLGPINSGDYSPAWKILLRGLTKWRKSRKPDARHLDVRAQVYLDIFLLHAEGNQEDSGKGES
jgi:hypothetical protein